MTKGIMFFFQHSNTPSLQFSQAESFKNFWQPLNFLFIGHSSVISSLGQQDVAGQLHLAMVLR